jgi:hypothetical protein
LTVSFASRGRSLTLGVIALVCALASVPRSVGRARDRSRRHGKTLLRGLFDLHAPTPSICSAKEESTSTT